MSAESKTVAEVAEKRGEEMNGGTNFTGRLVRPEPGRKYWNHMAKHTRGYWHRHWLVTSGQYIKTHDPDMRKGYGWKIVGEPGPELVSIQDCRGGAP